MASLENGQNSETKSKNWVRFEEDGSEVQSGKESSAAVINAETTQINIDKSKKEASENKAAVITPESVHINIGRSNVNRSASQDAQNINNKSALKSVDLRDSANGRPASLPNSGISNVGNAVIRQGFANGDIIVTLLPVNTRWPWITPAQFRPELVPEELMAQGLTVSCFSNSFKRKNYFNTIIVFSIFS